MESKKISIIIPSCKQLKELESFIKKIKLTVSDNFIVVPTCFNASAATNRNYGLNVASSEIVIMVDDDIDGFYKGWADSLIDSLTDNIMMVSARLINYDSSPAVMMKIKLDLSSPLVEATNKALPSACIAFRKDSTRYDENYVGAGFEDTDFCFQLNQKYPDKIYLINNQVKLVHKNEQKHLNIQNEIYFREKWHLPKRGQDL